MKKSHIIELAIFLIFMTILTFAGIKVFKSTFDIGKTYHLAFNDINGIVIGSPVRILGVDIGHVTKIKNDYDKIYIDFVVQDSKLKIPNGTRASIEFFGIAGSRSIELTPPSEQTDVEGLVVEEPYRVGHAFGIMAKFIRASMVSIGGLYEFAKSRTQEDVDNVTAKFLANTDATSRKLSDITTTIENTDKSLHKSFEGTTKGMTRFNNDIVALNISRTFNLSKYAVNVTRRTLINSHRRITHFNDNSEQYVNKVQVVLTKAETIPGNIKNLDNLFSSLESLDKAINSLDKTISQENLDKVYNTFEQVRVFSENLNKD